MRVPRESVDVNCPAVQTLFCHVLKWRCTLSKGKLSTNTYKRKGSAARFYSSRLKAYLFSFARWIYADCFDPVLISFSSKNLSCGSEWVASVLGLEIIVILHISALNRFDAQTLVIAATSWAMLFEEIIMEYDNEAERAWLHSTEYFFFFHLRSSPSVKAVIEDCTTQLSQYMSPLV